MLRYEGVYSAQIELTKPYWRDKLNRLCEEARRLRMTPLERKIADVRLLLKANGLEVWDQPAPIQIAALNDQIICWTMRIGDPATNNDLFVDSLNGEYGLWSEAEIEIRKFIANGKVEADA